MLIKLEMMFLVLSAAIHSSSIMTKLGTCHNVHHILITRWNSGRALTVQQVTHIGLTRLKQAQLPVDGTSLVLAAVLRCQHFFSVTPRVMLAIVHHDTCIVSDIILLSLQEHYLLFWIPILSGLYKLSWSHHSLRASWCWYTAVWSVRHAAWELIGNFHFVAHASFVQDKSSCISLVANEIILEPWLPSHFLLLPHYVTVTSFDVLRCVRPLKMAPMLMVFYDLHTCLKWLISAISSIVMIPRWDFNLPCSFLTRRSGHHFMPLFRRCSL